jgi:hypothetical protein
MNKKIDSLKVFKIIPYYLILEIIGKFIEFEYDSDTNVFNLFGYFPWDITRKIFFLFRSITLKCPILYKKEKYNILKLIPLQKLYSFGISGEHYDMLLEISENYDRDIALENNIDLLENLYIPHNSYFRYNLSSYIVPKVNNFFKKENGIVFVNVKSLPLNKLIGCSNLRNLTIKVRYETLENMNMIPLNLRSLSIFLDNRYNHSILSFQDFSKKLEKLVNSMKNLKYLNITLIDKYDIQINISSKIVKRVISINT